MTKDYLELQRFEFFKVEEQSKNWGRSLVTKLKLFKRVRTDSHPANVTQHILIVQV